MWATARRLKQNSGKNKMPPIKILKYESNTDKTTAENGALAGDFLNEQFALSGEWIASMTTGYVALLGRLVWSTWKAH